MEKFVHTADFKKLNVGFALDEGMASPNNEFLLYYGERCIWRKFSHFIVFEIEEKVTVLNNVEFDSIGNLLDFSALGLHNNYNLIIITQFFHSNLKKGLSASL